MGAHASQTAPAKPAAHAQVPAAWAAPWPVQVVASLYWQLLPAKPAAQAQAPEVSQVPLPPQVVDASQKEQVGYPWWLAAQASQAAPLKPVAQVQVQPDTKVPLTLEAWLLQLAVLVQAIAEQVG